MMLGTFLLAIRSPALRKAVGKVTESELRVPLTSLENLE